MDRLTASVQAHGSLKGDKTSEEIRLEESGEINILQRYRLLEHWMGHEFRPPNISHKLLFVEEDLREVVQEEIFIKEGPDSLSKDSQKRLDALNIQYWILAQRWWHCRSLLQDGVQLRAFELWRSHPRWYMHRVLVEDCAGRQGCCARGCDCCRKRKIDPMRKLGVGHCTFGCGCCRRFRGFGISEEDRKSLKEEFRKEVGDLVRHRNTRVAIWGLVGENFESPFDMIDAPPSYQGF